VGLKLLCRMLISMGEASIMLLDATLDSIPEKEGYRIKVNEDVNIDVTK
jgi:hypothetical protein